MSNSAAINSYTRMASYTPSCIKPVSAALQLTQETGEHSPSLQNFLSSKAGKAIGKQQADLDAFGIWEVHGCTVGLYTSKGTLEKAPFLGYFQGTFKQVLNLLHANPLFNNGNLQGSIARLSEPPQDSIVVTLH